MRAAVLVLYLATRGAARAHLDVPRRHARRDGGRVLVGVGGAASTGTSGAGLAVRAAANVGADEAARGVAKVVSPAESRVASKRLASALALGKKLPRLAAAALHALAPARCVRVWFAVVRSLLLSALDGPTPRVAALVVVPGSSVVGHAIRGKISARSAHRMFSSYVILKRVTC